VVDAAKASIARAATFFIDFPIPCQRAMPSRMTAPARPLALPARAPTALPWRTNREFDVTLAQVRGLTRKIIFYSIDDFLGKNPEN
jgi:hypothetical protein